MASATGLRRYLDLRADPLLQGGHMRNDAYQLAILLQAREGFQGSVEGFLVQGAEAFIQK